MKASGALRPFVVLVALAALATGATARAEIDALNPRFNQ